MTPNWLAFIISPGGKRTEILGANVYHTPATINCLTQQKNLCKTSKTPGRTQLINFFELDETRRLVDLPGYGFARVSKQLRNHWDQVLSTYLLQRQALRGLVIVVDIRRGISEMDQALIDMLNNSLPLHILLTKADKLSRNATRQAVQRAQGQLRGADQTVSTLSVQTREGIEQLERKCAEWLLLEDCE